MGLLDKKGRVFGKVSIVDLAIVLVLIAAGLWFAYAKFGRDLKAETAAREVPVEYTIVVAGVRPTTAEALAKGGKVFEFKTGAEIGTIKSVTTEPGDVWSMGTDGKWTRVEGKVDVYVTVTATAREGENVITINGVEARVGTSIGVTTKWAQVNGHIMTLEILSGASQSQ
ncbi:MAG TPA: DUF4330 domain-containing protein [Firmicutes bacterium]|nr:DUF4330 domain-containing protein [Candidatus Fermentithermobacillaceae bacterium]